MANIVGAPVTGMPKSENPIGENWAGSRFTFSQLTLLLTSDNIPATASEMMTHLRLVI